MPRKTHNRRDEGLLLGRDWVIPIPRGLSDGQIAQIVSWVDKMKGVQRARIEGRSTLKITLQPFGWSVKREKQLEIRSDLKEEIEHYIKSFMTSRAS